MSSYPPSKEEVIEVEADRVLGLPGRDVPRSTDREDLLVCAVVPILDAPDQALPDLVLRRRGHSPEIELRAGRAQLRANALGVFHVLEPQRRAKRLGPVVRGIRRPPPPGGVVVAARARGSQKGLVGLPAVVYVQSERELADARVGQDVVEQRSRVAVRVGLLGAGDPV